MPIDRRTLEGFRSAAVGELLTARESQGHWVGELSGSALSTATAVCALELYRRDRQKRRKSQSRDRVAWANLFARASQREDTGKLRLPMPPKVTRPPADERDLELLIRNGIAWLFKHQNEDGGWGDTIDSPSNISTTVLCWAALGVCSPERESNDSALSQCEHWLTERVGKLTPSRLAKAICDAYGVDQPQSGVDHTFSAPILTMCVLAGKFDDTEDAWKHVPSLPFELALIPHRWYHKIGLPVVSYAMPALIAIGQARHHHRPTWNPIARLIRNLARKKTLDTLLPMQPASGGYLEAAPITSFVVMSLVSIGRSDHYVVRNGIRFLVNYGRAEGCWPIDTNLATWTTTLAVNALFAGEKSDDLLTRGDQRSISSWLLDQQHTQVHPYTHTAPGGWAWTDLSGGVPDGDDTPGALLALRRLHKNDEDTENYQRVVEAATHAVQWLLDLQNKDGGIPTFCRGWGKLPFDRSSPDLTAHTLRAWTQWRDDMPTAVRPRLDRAINAAIRFLIQAQRADGSWVPLWFGNQYTTNLENPLYGTARVLLAADCPASDTDLTSRWHEALSLGQSWLLSAQNDVGGWGGDVGVKATIEETALAVEALAATHLAFHSEPQAAACADARSESAIAKGVEWLHKATAGGTRFEASPIGLYFAKLWYSEKLYPIVFTVAALERISRLVELGALGVPESTERVGAK